MKAITYEKYGPPDVLRVTEVAKPVPKNNEVLVKVHAAAVASEDCTFRKGSPFFARFATGLTRPKIPVLGSEFAGEIEAVGKDVGRFREGDEVFGSTSASLGCHAEYLCLPEDGVLATKPTNLKYESSLCGGFLTALPFLRDNGRIKSGQNVLINGASGTVGTSAVQLARHFGTHVTGVCSTSNIELVKSLGAEEVIDYTIEDFTRARETYDIIFDTVGKSSFSRCRRALKKGGIYLRTVPSLAILLQMLWTWKLGSRRAAIAFTGLLPVDKKLRDLVFIKQLMEAGEIEPVIDKVYPFEQIAEAHSYVETGHKKGNVVITMLDGSGT